MEDKNVIFVAGNGFDLAKNYDTRYMDFINYVKLRKNVQINKTIIDSHINSFINRYSKNISEIEKVETQEIKDILKNNCFIEYFLNSDFDIYIWSDFEEEMRKIINSISLVFNKKENNTKIRNQITEKKSYVCDLQPYDINVLITFKLITKGTPIISNGMLYHAIEKEYYDYIYKIKWKKIIRHLREELEGLKKALCFYLKEIVPIIKDCYEDDNVEYILSKIVPNHILSFNYTNYCEEYFEIDSLHLHGSLKQNDIVLGFGDEKDLDIEYAIFNKYFQRIQNKNEILSKKSDVFNVLEMQYTGENGNKLSSYKGNQIIFFGMSFDLTDEDYVREIYNSKNNEKIIVYYYDDIDFSNKVANLIKIFTKEIINEDIRTKKLVFESLK